MNKLIKNIRGDSLFEDKPYELYKGDCLEIMKNIPDKSIDMILCDLPYGTTRNKWDSIIPLDELWDQYNRIISCKGIIVLFSQSPFDKVLGYSNLKMLKYEWIWVKNKATGFLNSKHSPLKKHETILVFTNSATSYTKNGTNGIYNPQGLVKKDVPTINKGSRGRMGIAQTYDKANKDAIQEYENYPNDILYFDVVAKPVHPTQKPVDLLQYLIKTYTNESMIILDNTMGSGSTGVACMNTNRKFIGIELDDTYYDIAESRISEALKNKGLQDNNIK